MIQRFGVSGSGQDDLDHAPGQILPHAHGSAEPMRDLGDERQAQAIVVTAVGPGAMRGKAPEHVGAGGNPSPSSATRSVTVPRPGRTASVTRVRA